MTTGGHPPPEYAQKSLYVQQPSLRAGVFMVHQHYRTQTVNRGAVMPGMTTYCRSVPRYFAATFAHRQN
ncbi:hypothetical protein C6A58_22810 [Escherichia coli]|nr:hypothetical protein C6A58_22810 [Escherichia coli]